SRGQSGPNWILFRENQSPGDEREGEEAAPEHLLDRLGALDVARHHAGAAPQHRRGDHQRERRAARHAALRSARKLRSAAPVCPGLMPSGTPWYTIAPPPPPPSGPRSMSQSASAMTSRLCSITTAVLPASTRRCSTRISFSTSAMCRPTVGSSSTYRVLVALVLESS